jgi:hypothetical protein
MKKRKIYSEAGWRWLLCASRKVKNAMEQAELIYIILKPNKAKP